MKQLRKLIRYWDLIIIVGLLTLKFNVYYLFFSKRLMLKQFAHLNLPENILHIDKYSMQPLRRKSILIDKVIDYLPFIKKTCLIRTLVKIDFFRKSDILLDIAVATYKEGNALKAHCWIPTIENCNLQRINIS